MQICLADRDIELAEPRRGSCKNSRLEGTDVAAAAATQVFFFLHVHRLSVFFIIIIQLSYGNKFIHYEHDFFSSRVIVFISIIFFLSRLYFPSKTGRCCYCRSGKIVSFFFFHGRIRIFQLL